MTDEAKKDDEESTVSGLLGGLLGMGTSVAGMIPSLLKGPQDRQLKQIQAGGGAGAAMARQTGSEAAARIVGASTAQPSSGRGGALREGLRAADQAVQRGAQQAAITGAREGLAATQMLRGNELQRRAAFKTLGAGVGQGLAGIGSVLAAARDQGPDTAAQAAPGQAGGAAPGAAVPGAAVAPGAVPAQGASAQMQATRTLQGAPPGPPGILPGAGPFADDVQGDPRLAQEQYPGAQNKGVEAGPVSAGPPPAEKIRQGLRRVASPQAQEDKALSGLVDETAKRQKAEAGYMMTASTPEAEAFRTARKQQEEWYYYQAMNFDPLATGSQRGIDPNEAAQMLWDSGYEPDMTRLGIEGSDGKR